MALKVSIHDSMVSKPFSFTANCRDLESAIVKGISTLASSPTGTRNFIIVAAKNGRVYLAALGSDTFVVLHVTGAIASNSGTFSFEAERLLGIIKSRSEMVFSFTENQECEFKLIKGNYKGRIVTLPVTDEMVTLFNDIFSSKSLKSKATADFSPTTLEVLKEGLALTAVKDVFNGNSLLSYLSFTKNQVTVATFDNHHFGFYEMETEYTGPDFAIASPIAHFQLVDKLINGYGGDSKENYLFSSQQETLRVDADSFIIVLPLMQADAKNFETIPGFLSDSTKSTFSCGIDLEALFKVVENLFTLRSPNTTFDFFFKEGTEQLKVTFTSPSGTASDSLRIAPGKSKSTQVKVDPNVFKDTVSLAKLLKNPKIHIKADKCIMINAETKLGAKATFVCSLV